MRPQFVVQLALKVDHSLDVLVAPILDVLNNKVGRISHQKAMLASPAAKKLQGTSV